jgi:hypothetical protein
MYNVDKTQVDTRGGDMHMGTVIAGCLLFKNINTSRIRGIEKQTDAVTYIRMKVLIIYKEDDYCGHKWVIDNGKALQQTSSTAAYVIIPIWAQTLFGNWESPYGNFLHFCMGITIWKRQSPYGRHSHMGIFSSILK